MNHSDSIMKEKEPFKIIYPSNVKKTSLIENLQKCHLLKEIFIGLEYLF